jgi:hypothetical protein
LNLKRNFTSLVFISSLLLFQTQLCTATYWRVLIPATEYAPGKPPPPHLSPFVNAEEEGYTPDYQAGAVHVECSLDL